MSLQSEDSSGITDSHSHFLLGVCAYNALGVAWVTLVVVTKPASVFHCDIILVYFHFYLPVDFPAFCAQVTKLSNWADLVNEAWQSLTFTVLSTPAVLWLAFTPLNNAVAVLHESGTSLLAEYT